MPSHTSTKTTTAETTFTFRDQPYTYIHTQLTTLPSTNRTQAQAVLDEITLRQHLTSALTQSFGITGSAIAVDILKINGRDAWIRVQSEDAELLVASLSQWVNVKGTVALRVVGRAQWLGGLGRDDSMRDLWG